MEHVTIAGSVATLIGIIAADIKVPHREGRVDVFGCSEDSVSRDNQVIHIAWVLHHVAVEHTLRFLVVQKVRATCRTHQGKNGKDRI